MPTHDDAVLVVQLAQWGTTLGLDDALQAVFTQGFDPNTASIGEPAVQKALTFGETVATLVKHKLLDPEIVNDLWWLEGLWSRVGPAGVREREVLGQQRLYSNFEALFGHA